MSAHNRKAAGSMYHGQLAREVCDFLTSTLASHKKSHILTLTDLYALINRARGTELISPNDLLEATNLFEHLQLGFRTKRYASGVIVVQPVGLTQEGVEEKLRALAQTHMHDGITVSSVSQELLVSVPVALELLAAADESGAICRDEDPVAGVRFYRNLFHDHEMAQKSSNIPVV
jgi:ESCRT-II complex subunit VPS36